MRPRFAIVTALLTFGTLMSASDIHAQTERLLIVKGKDSGTFTVSPTSDPAIVFTEDASIGRASHLGRYTLEASELINLVTFEIFDGAFTITAKGGAISGLYSGKAASTSTPGIITWSVSGPITGGTGRFAGATGALTFHGVGDMSTGTFTEIISGTLILP